MAQQYSEDQSHAFEDQEQFQAPPELLVEPTPEELEKKNKRKRILRLVGGGSTAFVVIIIILMYVASNMNTNTPAPEPTPTPLPAQGPSNLRKELDRLQGIVDAADPVLAPFSPPPVDMEVEF